MSSYFYSTIQSTQTSAVGVVTAAYSLSVLAEVPSSPERLGRSYTKPQHMSAPHRTDRVHTSWGHKVPTSVIHTVYRLHLPVVLKLGFKSSSSATDIHGSLHSHSTCSAPPEILVKGSWGLFISEQTVQWNSNMSRIWLQALFICKPRFHHWLTCLHWLLINELQKFVMHESFIWAGVTQTAGFPRDLRTPRGAELKVERDHPSAASQSPDSLTDLWPFGNDRRVHNCSANAHQQGGHRGVEVPRRITQTTKKHAV